MAGDVGPATLAVGALLALLAVFILLAWALAGRKTRRVPPPAGLLIAIVATAVLAVLMTYAGWFDYLLSGHIVDITLLSLFVSGTSTLIATLIALPAGTYLGLREHGGLRLLRNILFTLYGFPPVLAGLLVLLLLSRSGPLGVLGLLYTPMGMVIAQVIIVTPIILGVTMSVVSTVERRVKDTAFVLGADRAQLSDTVIRESAAGVLTAVMVGFGRAISEVGAVYIVGGHLEGHTQVLTTTIITDVEQANYVPAVVLGVILLVIAGFVYFLLYRLQEKVTL